MMRAMPRRSTPMLLTAAAAVLLGSCSVIEDASRGSDSVMAIMQPPTPSEAAEMALDPYNADNRFKGIQLLSSADFGGQPVYIRLYEDALDDDDAGVRLVAVKALGRHGSPEHAEPIVERLVKDEPLVRAEAARSLQRLHNPVAVAALIRSLKRDAEPLADVRTEAAAALGQYAENRVVQALVGSLTDQSLAVNRATLASLRTLTGQDFGLDTRAWLDWIERHEGTVFAARQPYTYPGFYRERRPYEYIPLPFIPQPPNETGSTPVGMPPMLDS